MQAIMPRQKTCAMCGNPIAEGSRIDRIYCGPSCCNLAWRLRTGKRWGGRAKPASVRKPADPQARGALLRRARGIKSELAAAHRLIDVLKSRVMESPRRADIDRKTIASLRVEMERAKSEHRADLEKLRSEFESERERMRTESAAAEQERLATALRAERAKGNDALGQVYAMVRDLRYERAGAVDRYRAAESEKRKLLQENADLRRQLDEKTDLGKQLDSTLTEVRSRLALVQLRSLTRKKRLAETIQRCRLLAASETVLRQDLERARKRAELTSGLLREHIEARKGWEIAYGHLKWQYNSLEGRLLKEVQELLADTQQQWLRWGQQQQAQFAANQQQLLDWAEGQRLLFAANQQQLVAWANKQQALRAADSAAFQRERAALQARAQKAEATIRRLLAEPERKRLPAPKDTDQDKLLAVMRKKVRLLQGQLRAQKLLTAQAEETIEQLAQAEASKARNAFLGRVWGALKTSAKWLVAGRLLDRQSERILLIEQSREVKRLEGRVGPFQRLALPPKRE